GTLQAVAGLSGVLLPAGSLESLVLPARVTDYVPGMLDELVASGEVVWRGHARLPGQDGLVSLALAGEPDVLASVRGEWGAGAQAPSPSVSGEPVVATDAPDSLESAAARASGEIDVAVLGALAEGGATFLPALLARS